MECCRTALMVLVPATSCRNGSLAHHGLDVNQLLPSIYRNHGVAAASHLVRVAAGLNSMVLGEPQIFGQMKSAFAVAQEAGAVGFHLNLIFPEAFRIAKRVRTDTAIGENPVSVAYAAVDLARQIFSDMERGTALLVGCRRDHRVGCEAFAGCWFG